MTFQYSKSRNKPILVSEFESNYIQFNTLMKLRTFPRKSNRYSFLKTSKSKYIEIEYEKRHNAAKIIQKCWRSYRNRLIYFRLKEFLQKCSKVKPSLVLRTINPKEAALLDAPSGSVVKFRLAGTKFPPKVVYKIFSNRPVARVSAILPTTIKNFNKGDFQPILHEKQKNEYNDWRVYVENKCVNNFKKDRWKQYVTKRIAAPKPSKLESQMSWIKNYYGI